MNGKIKVIRNKTIVLAKDDESRLNQKIMTLTRKVSVPEIVEKTICQDLFKTLEYLPENFVDLLFVDPPYNLTKKFNSCEFKEISSRDYENWLDSWLKPLRKILKSTASIYICGDWKSSSAIFRVMSKYFKVRNRITWEREKGRGAKTNWKNCSEDIWFGTVSNKFRFQSDAVMLKKKVIAPYHNEDGEPKDWSAEENGIYRLTYPSNLWTDTTIPFWSMPENTKHPTQKPEKLLAKIILASSKENDFIFDPFLGSGTTSVVAKKLNRRYCGIEIDEFYCCLAEKRLEIADKNKSIQGFINGVFWERNSLNDQTKNGNKKQFVITKNLFNFIKV